MIIYHYSDKPRRILKTIEAQNILKKDHKELLDKKFIYRKEKLPYYKHISFAIDEIPFNSIIEAYEGKNHHIYKKGNIVYCHYIDIDQIYFNTPWDIVETPIDTFFYDKLWLEYEVYEKFLYRVKRLLNSVMNNTGDTTPQLKNALRKFKGSYIERFGKLINRKDFNELSGMYAPTIPHVFLYPPSGQIKPIKVKKIVL